MQKFIFFLLLLAPWVLAAQNTEGQISFTETVQLRIELPPDASEEMKKMLPSSRSSQQVLFFDEKACLYRDASEADADATEINGQAGGGEVRIKMMRPENRLYRDLESDAVVESREFMGRFFLIKDAPKAHKWKIGSEQKEILGYRCQKAVLQDTSRKVTAWFTPQIPVSLGPAGYAELPGMILELNIGDGQTVVAASKVEFKKLDKKDIEKPTKGKECTRAEYEKIVEEKRKEMQAEGGGGGMRVIIRN